MGLYFMCIVADCQMVADCRGLLADSILVLVPFMVLLPGARFCGILPQPRLPLPRLAQPEI